MNIFKTKKTLEEKKRLTPFLIVAAILIGVYSLTLILPLVWAAFSSLKLGIDFADTVFAWPKYGFQWENWVDSFEKISIKVMKQGQGLTTITFIQMFGYSLIYCVCASFINVFSRSACAYVVAKYKDLGWTKFIHTLVIILMTVSFPSNLAITIKFYKFTGMYDNFIFCILMSFGFSGTYFLYFYAAYSGVSKEYMEAAEVDGANQLIIMLKLIMPMVTNFFVALFILQFIAYWNDYTASLVYLPSYPMVSYGLFKYQFATGGTSSVPMKLSGCTLVFIPTLILFIVFRNKIISSVSIGGLKG